MARPPMPANRRKTRKLTARFNEAEIRIIRQRAREDGLTVADELRRAVGLPPRMPPYEIELLARINAQCGKIGSNANQCARVLNEGGYPEAEAFRQVQKDVAWIRAELARALRVEPC